MSGSVAEALMASGSKKLPLLPPPPKIKKEPKTFCFELTLPESNDQSYPEFSWVELCRNEKQKELSKKVESGGPVLDPFASDDEEDLKAMAAKFEAKYNNTAPPKKKKRRAEDYIDRGAGYDESDPFIDNSDVYDEVVPVDLQPVHGGFYINSGTLDFKEVELSEDEDDSLSLPPKVSKGPKIKITKVNNPNAPNKSGEKEKNPVGRPPGVSNKRPLQNPGAKGNAPKKRRVINLPEGSVAATFMKKPTPPVPTPGFPNRQSGNEKPKTKLNVNAMKIKNVRKIQSSSSSSGSSSSSSGGSSSSSGSDSSSGEENEEDKDKKQSAPKIAKSLALKKPKPKPSAETFGQGQSLNPLMRPPSNKPIAAASGAVSEKNPLLKPLKKLKTKNVPLNPKLHPALLVNPSTSLSPSNLPKLSSPSTTLLQQQQPAKLLTKDLIKTSTSGGGTLSIISSAARPLSSPVNSSMLATSISSTSITPTSNRIAPLKHVVTTTPSPSSSISAVTPTSGGVVGRPPGISQSKPKVKAKPPNPSGIPLELFSSMTSSYNMIPTINFAPPALSPNSLFKGGANLIVGPQKAMPHLKKIASSATDKPIPKQSKLQTMPSPSSLSHVTKPKKVKQITPVTQVTPSTQLAQYGTSGGSVTGPFVSTLNSYKTPPPLGGPGVELSKHRTPPSSGGTSAMLSTPKSISNSSLMSAVSLASVVSLAQQVQNPLVTSNSFVSSFLSAAVTQQSRLVNSVPSSLSVQRLPHSITITPTPHTPTFSGGVAERTSAGSSSVKGNEHIPKPVKHISSFDVSALLNQPTVSYTNAALLGGLTSTVGASSKMGDGKTTGSKDVHKK